MRTFDCSDPDQRRQGLERAAAAVRRGDLVVLPTDTVYGVGCDAFSATAVDELLAAKGRGRDMPVPVLIGSLQTLDGIATGLGPAARELVLGFWPGAVTVVCRAQPSLRWDLGDTGGTVAVRMPLHPVAIELLTATGPMAVSSANRTGMPAPSTADAAAQQLGEDVAVYLDGGATAATVPSTIVDVTGPVPRLLRAGAVPVATLRTVVPDLIDEQAGEQD